MKERFVRVGDTCTLTSGYTPKAAQLYSDGSIPYYKVSDMNRCGNEHLLIHTELFLKEAKKTFPKDAIVFPKNGGAVATNKKRVLSCDSVVDLNTGIAIPNKDTLPRYLFYFFLGVDFNDFIKEGTLPVLKTKTIADLPIYRPSLSEQQRIVDILDAEFEKIDRLRSNAEQNLRHAKDLFQAVLKTGLEPKEGWHKVKLGDLASFKNGLNFGKEIGSYKYCFLGVGDFKDNEVLDAKNLSFIKKDKIDEEYFLRENDIVFVRSNGSKRLVGRCLRVFNVNDDTVYSGFCIRCRLTDKRALPQYIVRYCSTEKVRKILASSGEGCNISNLNQKVLSSLVIDIPPTIHEQRAIISNIEDMKNKCKVLQENYTKTIDLCDDLKQVLLRKAFSGDLSKENAS